LKKKKIDRGKQETSSQAARKKSQYTLTVTKKKSLAPIYAPTHEKNQEKKTARRPRSSVRAVDETNKDDKEKEVKRRPKTSKIR